LTAVPITMTPPPEKKWRRVFTAQGVARIEEARWDS
jgi:hypothetical protein